MVQQERIGRAAAALRGEIDRLLEQEQELCRELEAIEAEQPPNASARRWIVQQERADLEQRMLLAQCELVSTRDARYWPARRTADHLRRRILSGPLNGRERKRARSRLKVREPENEAA